MKVTVVCEEPKKPGSMKKLYSIFQGLKKAHPSLDARLRVITDIDKQIKGNPPKNGECLIIFGAKLYNYYLNDINEFDKLTGGTKKRDVHKFSYFIKAKGEYYFLACMPPIDLAMSKPETHLAFESCISTLTTTTENFRSDLRSIFLNKSKPARANWNIDVIENGLSAKSYIHLAYADSEKYMQSLMDLPDWHNVAIDIETTGLQLWDLINYGIMIIAFSTEDNVGHSVNLGLPGLMGCLTPEQKIKLLKIVETYIFDKPKIFEAWNAPFDAFGLCNFFKRSYRDFKKNNIIIDGMQLLHAYSENRKIEGYNAKAALRDFQNYAQYSYLTQYLDYLKNWHKYTVEQILEAATNSMKYAADDAAGEKALVTMFLRELDNDEILKPLKDFVLPEIMNVKMENEYSGIKVDVKNMVKGSVGYAGWETDNIVKPIVAACAEATDGRLHPDMLLFSDVRGRLTYKKPTLNQLKVGTNLSEHFLADEGCSLVYIDISSADVRSAALLSQDKNLVNDLSSEKDLYSELGKEIFKREVTEKERELSKTFVLSMLNLAGTNTMAEQLEVSTKTVEDFKETFYKRYPNLLEMKNRTRDFLRNNGYVFSASFRKRRFSEDDLGATFFWKSFLSAHNFIYAALTSDMMMMNCSQFLKETEEYNVKQCYLNSDAAVFNVPDEHLEAVKLAFDRFGKVPVPVQSGTLWFNKLIMKNEKPNELFIPFMKYKLMIGKNLKNMEKW